MNAKNTVANEIREGKRLPELLSPAGSYEALMAAIEGGADAVYMGAVAFNARINAKNFTEEELKRGIALAHAYGKKVYIAANTCIYDRELDGFLRAAEFAYTAGADALIVADLGAAGEIRRRIPIELHASTQCSGHGTDMALRLSDMGFSRMVCAREMKKEDIEHFIDVSPLEAEVFVHGALCVCHSGQCLFSSLVGGRSGNRGECAQPCRLPYGKKGEYPLSLKDLTLAEHIPELIRLGVSSLKIEGRMKSPEYVRDVTAIWRRLLDARTAATRADIKELSDIFSRSGFTDGYFTGRIGSHMLGVRSEGQKQVTRELKPFSGITKKIPLALKASVLRGKPIMLCAECEGRSACVYGPVPEEARTAPTDKSGVSRSLLKLGDTPFAAASMDIELDDGLMVPVSWLNSLRRELISKLFDEPLREMPSPIAAMSKPSGKRYACRTAVFYNPDAIPTEAGDYFDIVYTPLEKYTGNTNGVLIPEVVFDSEMPTLEKLLERAMSLGARHALVGNYGHIDAVLRAGLMAHADMRMNITNSPSVACAEQAGLEDAVLSPELTLPQIRDIGGAVSVCVYGRVPLMVTEKCVGKELGGCEQCKAGFLTLTDRRGITFPVMRTTGHRSVIFNSVPIYMADRQEELKKAGVQMQHFIFTVESAREARRIIEAYKRQMSPSDSAKIKRIK